MCNIISKVVWDNTYVVNMLSKGDILFLSVFVFDIVLIFVLMICGI